MQIILNKYNNTEHSTIKIKPVEAVKKENRMWVWWHIHNEAKYIESIQKYLKTIMLE